MQPKKKRKPKKISPSYLRNSGLFYLQRYAASSHQFQTAMRRKIDRSCFAHPEQNKEECYQWLDDVTNEFKELGYLNDAEYLRGMVRSLRLIRGLSTRMVILKLSQKGFNSNEVEKELSHLANDEDSEWNAALTYARHKKLGPYHPIPPRKEPEKQIAALARAGFSYDICKRLVMEELAENYQ